MRRPYVQCPFEAVRKIRKQWSGEVCEGVQAGDIHDHDYKEAQQPIFVTCLLCRASRHEKSTKKPETQHYKTDNVDFWVIAISKPDLVSLWHVLALINLFEDLVVFKLDELESSVPWGLRPDQTVIIYIFDCCRCFFIVFILFIYLSCVASAVRHLNLHFIIMAIHTISSGGCAWRLCLMVWVMVTSEKVSKHFELCYS